LSVSATVCMWQVTQVSGTTNQCAELGMKVLKVKPLTPSSMSACGPWWGPKRLLAAAVAAYTDAFWRLWWQFMQSLPVPPSVTTVPSARVTSFTERTRCAAVVGSVCPCGSWQDWHVTALYVVSGVFTPFILSVKPDPVWHPTQASRPAPEGSRVATAWRELFHSPFLM